MEIATVTSLLTPLVVLPCPVGMGVMMWVMMKGNRSQQQSSREPPSEPPSLELLREEQRRLSEEIDRLDSRQSTETSERR